MSMKVFSATPLVLAMCVATFATHADTGSAFTAGKPILFQDGDAATRKGLSKYPELADIVEGRFSLATADFNDDGRVELILRGADSSFCGSGGCQTCVVAFSPTRQIKVLLTRYFGGEIAMTNEKVNGYRALASVTNGKIDIADRRSTPMHAALHGRQIAYPMEGVRDPASDGAAAGAANEPAPLANKAEPNKASPSIAGMSLGMTAAEARRILSAHLRGYRHQGEQISEVAFVGVGANTGGAAPFVWQLVAQAGQGQSASKSIQTDTFTVTLSPPPNARVIKIHREIRFTLGHEVDIASLHDQLNGKYGPAFQGASRSMWFFDGQNMPAKAPAATRAEGNCSPLRRSRNLENIFNNVNVYKRGQAIFGLNPACGVVLELEPGAQLKGPTALANTALLDSDGFLNAILDGFAYLNGQAEAAAEQNAAKAKKRPVPTL